MSKAEKPWGWGVEYYEELQDGVWKPTKLTRSTRAAARDLARCLRAHRTFRNVVGPFAVVKRKETTHVD